MPYRNSIDKVITTYVASVAAEPFEYNNIGYEPQPLWVTPLLGREFKCVLKCAGCCPRFTLDWLPYEDKPDLPLVLRKVEVSGRRFDVYSYMQGPMVGRWHCDNVDMKTGGCGIHGRQPFSCDFETVRFFKYLDHTVVRTAPFGRAWALKRIDMNRGALCEFGEITPQARQEAIRRLTRLEGWCNYFMVKNKVPQMIEYLVTEQTGKICI